MTPNNPNPSITPTIASSPPPPNPLWTSKPSAAAPTASATPLVAARVAIATILAYQVLSVAAIMANPQWNPLTRQLSEYALGHQGWLQASAFLASALSYAALFVALRPHANRASGRIGLGMLAYCVLATVGVAIFDTDPMSTPSADVSVHGALHVLFGGTALVLLPVAALLVTRSLARTDPSRSPSRRTLYRIAYLPLAGFALIWIPELVGLLPARGWPDRILFVTYTAWVIAVAAPLGRRADQSA